MAQTDILEYLRKTPHNTNVNVVKGMLNSESGGSNIMLVNIEIDQSDPTPTIDRTFNELKSAFLNNVPICTRLIQKANGENVVISNAPISFYSVDGDEGTNKIIFDVYAYQTSQSQTPTGAIEALNAMRFILSDDDTLSLKIFGVTF